MRLFVDSFYLKIYEWLAFARGFALKLLFFKYLKKIRQSCFLIIYLLYVSYAISAAFNDRFTKMFYLMDRVDLRVDPHKLSRFHFFLILVILIKKFILNSENNFKGAFRYSYWPLNVCDFRKTKNQKELPAQKNNWTVNNWLCQEELRSFRNDIFRPEFCYNLGWLSLRRNWESYFFKISVHSTWELWPALSVSNDVTS